MRLLALSLLPIPVLLAAAEPAPPARERREPTAEAAANPLAPVGGAALSTHGPFASGDCAVCHEPDGKRVGRARKPVAEVCLGCHRDLSSAAGAAKAGHPLPVTSCTDCHNPHNSLRKSLLL